MFEDIKTERSEDKNSNFPLENYNDMLENKKPERSVEKNSDFLLEKSFDAP